MQAQHENIHKVTEADRMIDSPYLFLYFHVTGRLRAFN